MRLFNIVAILISLTASFSYINYKYLKLPKTVALMLMSLSVVIGLGLIQAVTGIKVATEAANTVAEINFSDALLKIVLCFLLFAGALHINLNAFAKQRWAIGILSTLGVVLSALIIGVCIYFVLPLIGLKLPLSVCFLFGTLISPTDPVAVLAMLKEAKVPHEIEMKVAGESLLNDGVGVVLFLAILGVVNGTSDVSFASVGSLLLRDALGGIIFGLATGYIAFLFLKQVDNYRVEILISLALVVGGYALADVLHVSGPLAMVAAGLLIGNQGRAFAMSEETRKNLDLFWEVVDDILNAALFVLVGLEALLLNVKPAYVIAGILVIPIALFARFASVWISAMFAGLFQDLAKRSVEVLTWGGLRGGISFALALALAPGEIRDALLLMTYMVVVFSVLVQGLTMKRFLVRMEV